MSSQPSGQHGHKHGPRLQPAVHPGLVLWGLPLGVGGFSILCYVVLCYFLIPNWFSVWRYIFHASVHRSEAADTSLFRTAISTCCWWTVFTQTCPFFKVYKWCDFLECQGFRGRLCCAKATEAGLVVPLGERSSQRAEINLMSTLCSPHNTCCNLLLLIHLLGAKKFIW